jgi:ABC-type sulfate/molybdate transport systems ATPase subunit
MIEFHAYKLLNTVKGTMPLDVSFRLEEGQLMSLYGKSGAGKTTILRILAGLTNASQSYIKELMELGQLQNNKPLTYQVVKCSGQHWQRQLRDGLKSFC